MEENKNIEEYKKLIETCPEAMLYFIINEMGGFIWRMDHEMADGRIGEEHHAAIDKDIANVHEQQQLAVQQTPRFGVETPTQGENNAPTEQYWKWFRWWDNYIKGLSEKEWNKMKKLMDEKGDYSKYRPKGTWK